MPARVDDVEPGAEHADHRAAGVERALVRGGVDPDGEPAHHGEPRPGERGAELVGVGEPVGRRRPGADDRDPAAGERLGRVTLGEQHRRSLRDRRRSDSPAAPRRRRGCGASRASWSTRSVRRDLLPDARQRDARRELVGRRAVAQHRRREPALRDRRARRPARRRVRARLATGAGVMSGRHASVAAATSIGSSGGAAGRVEEPAPLTARHRGAATPGRGGRRR